MYFQALTCAFTLILLHHELLVAGDSVVVHEQGDGLTLTVEEEIDWKEKWKFCLSMKETDVPAAGGSNTAEILMLMGQEEGEIIEKVGLGVVSTTENTTTIEVVQTKRNVTAGIIDIWISEETLETDQRSAFESCIINNGLGSSMWTATFSGENIDVASIEVNKSIEFEPTQHNSSVSPEVTVEKLDDGINHHIEDVNIQTDCISQGSQGDDILCLTHSTSLQNSDSLTILGEATQVHGSSSCTGAGVRFGKDEKEILVETNNGTATGQFPITLCGSFIYDHTAAGTATIEIQNGNRDVLLSISFTEASATLTPALSSTSVQTASEAQAVWHSFCVRWREQPNDLLTILDGAVTVDTHLVMPIPSVFESLNLLTITLTSASDVGSDFYIIISDLHIFGGQESIYFSSCKEKSEFTGSERLLSWNDRIISSSTSYQLITRPTFVRTIIELAEPLVSCKELRLLDHATENANKRQAIDMCYHNPQECGLIVPTAIFSEEYLLYAEQLCDVTAGIEFIKQTQLLKPGNVETSYPGQMIYNDFVYVLPMNGYLGLEGNFYTVQDGNDCLSLLREISFDWSFATYNTISGICAVYMSMNIDYDLMTYDYYSSFYLPLLDSRERLQSFHNATQSAFSISSRLCINVSSDTDAVTVSSNRTLEECAWECLARADCVYFQAYVGMYTTCALFAQSHVCGENGSTEVVGLVWGNPYLRRFNKKYCDAESVLWKGSCVFRTTSEPTEQFRFSVSSVTELQGVVALVGDDTNSYDSIEFFLQLSALNYSSCNQAHFPGFYYFVDHLQFCDAAKRFAILFPGSFGLPLAVLPASTSSSMHQVDRDTDVQGKVLQYYPMNGKVATLPLFSPGFDRTIFHGKKEDLSQTTAFETGQYINTIHLHVWLNYQIPADSHQKEGTVLQIGDVFSLFLNWSEQTQAIDYGIEINKDTSQPTVVGPSDTLLSPGTWYLIDAFSNSTFSYLRILDIEDNLVYISPPMSGLHTNQYKRDFQEVVLKFSGMLTCMYLFYERSPFVISGRENLCALSGYAFDDAFSTVPSGLVNRKLKGTLRFDGTLTSVSVEEPQYVYSTHAQETTELCTDSTHVTITYSHSLTKFPLSTLQPYARSVVSRDWLLSSSELGTDRLVCDVSSGAKAEGTVCWKVRDLSENEEQDTTDLCLDCNYLLITRRNGASTTDKYSIADFVIKSIVQRWDCLDYCSCSPYDYWIEAQKSSAIPAANDIPGEQCYCQYGINGNDSIPYDYGTHECEMLCPHWKRDYFDDEFNQRLADCASLELRESRVCESPDIIVSGTLISTECYENEIRERVSTTDYVLDICPTMSLTRSVCDCTTFIQNDIYFCNPPAKEFPDIPTQLVNAACDVYYSDVTQHVTNNNCSNMCPQQVIRPCCVANISVLTGVCSHDETIGMENFNCTREIDCFTECLNIIYQVDCTTYIITSNVTGHQDIHVPKAREPTANEVCSSQCDEYTNYEREGCYDMTTSTSTTASTSTSAATPTSTSTTSNTPESTTTTTQSATSFSLSPSIPVGPSESTSPSTTRTTATTAASETATTDPTTASTTHTAEQTSPPTTTAHTSTSTTTRPTDYVACNCMDGTVYNVSGEDRHLQEGINCTSSCPTWSGWTEYCFCAVKPVIEFARTCIEGNNEKGYLLELPSVCDLENVENSVTDTACVCPYKKNVSECDCNYKYGRQGYECIHGHPNPLEGVCSKNDVQPYQCKEQCSSYESWGEWSECSPCSIGNLEGTHSRSRNCSLPELSKKIDFMGTQECNDTQYVEEACDCGYSWSEWSYCNCNTGLRERNRCWDNYPLAATTVPTVDEKTSTAPMAEPTVSVAPTEPTTSKEVSTATEEPSDYATNKTNNSSSVGDLQTAPITSTTARDSTSTMTDVPTSTISSVPTITDGSKTSSNTPSAVLPNTTIAKHKVNTAASPASSTTSASTDPDNSLDVQNPTSSAVQDTTTNEPTTTKCDRDCDKEEVADTVPITSSTAISTTTHPSQQTWCIELEECSQFCPQYSAHWGEWEPCNCFKNRRFRDCLYPENLNGVKFLANSTECTEPLPDYSPCAIPGCYSDWTTWSQCSCSMTRSNRTRECLEDSCTGSLIQYEPCKLENLQCWLPWSDWNTCTREDGECGAGGSTSRTRYADCSNTPHLSVTCFQRTETETNNECVVFTCTKFGLWGEWNEWQKVKRCGPSNRTRTRNCEYSYRSVESWRNSTCDVDCWQCIADESNKRCFESICEENCKLAGITEAPPEFDLTFKCKDDESGEYIDNSQKEKRGVRCGTGNVWSEWTSCGISCGFQWGKQYRSQTCNLNEDEQISETCKNVLYLQVQPKWCFVKEKCPEESIVATLIPEEQKAMNLPAVESDEGVYMVSGILLVVVGVFVLIVVLDVPSIIFELNVRLLGNLKSACGINKPEDAAAIGVDE